MDLRLVKKILKIEKELDVRFCSNKLNFYNKKKIHKKQIAFHKCRKRNRWVFGGNRSGKTECGAVETVYLACGLHPYKKNKPTEGWVVSLSRQVQRDVAQKKILDYLPASYIEKIVMVTGGHDSAENGIIDFILVRSECGGVSRIGFKSCDQGREKFQGASLDYVWFDEEPPLDIYMECKMRVLDKCGQIFGTMTPLKGLTWVYNTIYLNDKQDKEVWYEMMEWADNPYLSKKEIESMTKSMSAEEIECRRYGKFMHNGGMVYSEFDENVNVIEPFEIPPDWQDNISIDPGLHNPLSAHFYAVDFDGNVYVVAEHYMAQQTVEFHAEKIKEIADRLKWKKDRQGRLHALIDSAANQRTLASEKNVVELFYDNGILVDAKVNKDLFAGISVVKSYLKTADGKSRLFIFKNCVNLIREIKNYWWGDGDVPIKKDDHALDELRYYLMTRPINRERIEKSEIQKDKEKMIKKLKYQKFKFN
ncbi:MAG: terminase family protein [Clostridia bacterium]|nr:terminase family protein [Clostridia bacterium]